MEYTDKEFCLEVWSDMACFTRPELKVERVSYDVITPSAAREPFLKPFFGNQPSDGKSPKLKCSTPLSGHPFAETKWEL